MKTAKIIMIALALTAASLLLVAFNPDPCVFTSATDLTVYRLPITGSDVFGTMPAGETREILAQTADGWLGFDPGIAQAGNVGLARHRWIQLNASITPACLASVDLVTLGEVEHDIGLNNLNPPDLVITDVSLPLTPITENLPVPIEVTVENQGDGTSTGYEIFIFPGYGKGSTMPTEQEPVPDLAGGASHTFSFSPGVVYPSAGDYLLRVLVTDNWNTPSGGPNSTGTNGDIEDTDIHVSLGLCNPFAGMEISFVLLNLPADSRALPVYIKVEDNVIPGMNGDPQNEFTAKLGDITANQCGSQGFPDRLYCMFTIPEGEEGTAKYFELRMNDCQDPVFVIANVLIPEPKKSESGCKADLNEEKCNAAGGTFYRLNDKTSTCVCP